MFLNKSDVNQITTVSELIKPTKINKSTNREEGNGENDTSTKQWLHDGNDWTWCLVYARKLWIHLFCWKIFFVEKSYLHV